jgi:hypothetical protein
VKALVPATAGRLRSVTGGATPQRISDESPSPHLAWRSRRDTRVAIQSSTSASSQPTVFVVSWRLEGNCPRHSRRQSVVRDSPVRAQTSRHRRRRAGERPACAGWSDASVPSWLSRALLTSADATRWKLKAATCVHCGERIRSHYEDRADSLIADQYSARKCSAVSEIGVAATTPLPTARRP